MTQRRLQELLAPVLEASHEADLRREVMRHVCDCLSEPTGKRWQRIYGGLVLTEKLVQQGSPVLLIETAHGHHFDLVQKISLVEKFDSATRGCPDPRAQQHIRRKASELLSLLMPRLKKAAAEELPQNAGLGIKDSLSVCSPSGMSMCTTTDASVGCSSLGSVPTGDFLTEPGSPPEGHWPASSGSGASPSQEAHGLLETLRRLTEAEVAAPAPEHFRPVLEASHDADGRQAIMWHLQQCLAGPPAQHWRHIHGGLLLVEVLMEHGSPLIFTEPTPGVNLDLPKQIWFLEQFEYRTNWRAQNMVRKKAIGLREKMVPWLLKADKEDGEELAPVQCEQIDDAFATLRFWAESLDDSASSSSRASVTPPPSESPPGVSETDLQSEASCARTPAASAFFEADASDGGGGDADAEAAADTFFTPMQTPAVGLAGVRAPLLVSL